MDISVHDYDGPFLDEKVGVPRVGERGRGGSLKERKT